MAKPLPSGPDLSNALLAEIDRVYAVRYSHSGDIGANAFKTGYLISTLARVLERSPAAKREILETIAHLAGKQVEPRL